MCSISTAALKETTLSLSKFPKWDDRMRKAGLSIFPLPSIRAVRGTLMSSDVAETASSIFSRTEMSSPFNSGYDESVSIIPYASPSEPRYLFFFLMTGSSR